MHTYYYVQFAQAYGEGAYNACTYNDTTCSTSGGGGTTPGGAPNNGNGLSNTGLMIWVVITIACLLVFAALLVRFWRRPSRRQLAPEPVATDAEQPEQLPQDNGQFPPQR